MKTILILIVLLITGPAQAATRLGLHVTQEELNVWRARITDNVNTINGFTFQSVYQNRIKADADSFLAQSHPGGDGHWEGYTAGGCVPVDDQSVAPGDGGTPYGRGNGGWMMRSAFTFLLTGNTTYAAPVRTELLQQITEVGTNFSNTSKWCVGGMGGGNLLEIIPWLIRLVISYDYLIAGGYSGFSGTERTNIENWFLAAAQYFDGEQVNIIQSFTRYPGIYDTSQDLTILAGPGFTVGPAYFGGPTLVEATYFTFFNQLAVTPALSMAVGLMTSNSTLINHAAAYFTAFIKAGIFDNGAISDYQAWQDCTPECPGSMWGHAQAAISPLIAVADMYARSGNTSLYDLTAATQVINGSGGTVGLSTVIGLFAAIANGTTLLYGTTSAGEQDAAHLLTWNGNDGDYYLDFSSMPANLYYRNSAVTTAMTRNSVSANTSTGCVDPQAAGCFSAIWASWADLPFMFGKMEANAANPFLTVPLGLP